MTCGFCDLVERNKIIASRSTWFEVSLYACSNYGRLSVGKFKPKYCPVCGKRLLSKSPKQTNISDLEGWPFES